MVEAFQADWLKGIETLIHDLISSGQFGVLVGALLIVIAGSFWVIWFQRQLVARFESLNKSVELSVKAADTARDQSLLAQEKIVEGMQKQYDMVVKTNDELRKELERIRSERARLQKDVKEALSIGFEKIRTSLRTVTVSELIDQIPKTFRDDMQKEIEGLAVDLVARSTERLRQRFEALSIYPSYTHTALVAVLSEALINCSVRYRFSHDVRSETELLELAECMARSVETTLRR